MPSAASPLAPAAGERLLSGWGRTAPSTARVQQAHSARAVQDAVSGVGPRGLLARGLGRSYGDAAQSGGGTIQASSDVVSFRGGAYAGWSGARRGEAIVFRKDDQSNPRAGESIKSGDFRCGRRSG